MGPASCSAGSLPVAITSPAVSLRNSLQSSSSSPPSISHCHAAIQHLNEPLFFNRQLFQSAASSATTNSACPTAAVLTPQQKPLMLSAGVTKVAHLRLSLQASATSAACKRVVISVLLALPPAWRAVVSSAPASTWFQVLSASGIKLIQDAQTSQLHTISLHLQLQQIPSETVSNPNPVQVVSWDPSRPWRGPPHQSAQQGSPLYSQGELWRPHR